MAWTTPFTAVTGATITAASHNTSYRDNLNTLWVYTTAGDIAYASSSSVLSRLAIGTDFQVLRATGGLPVWSKPLPGALVRSTVGLFAQNNTDSAQTYDTLVYDDLGMWNAGTPTRLTAPATGVYLVGGFQELPNASSGAFNVRIMVNGSYNVAAHGTGYTSVVYANPFAVTDLNLNDYIEMRTTQNSGGSVSGLTGTRLPAMWMLRLK